MAFELLPSHSQTYASNTALKLLQLAVPGFEGNFKTQEHLHKTPHRFANMLTELTTKEDFEFTTFENVAGIDEMVIIDKIPFYTLCAHHVIPFFGYAHIAYVPNTLLAGLSKFVRTVKQEAKGLWTQEELTASIADFLEHKLSPLGVAVVMQAEHLCMAMRGVATPGAVTTTSAMRGVFLDSAKGARSEFLSLVTNR